MTTIGRACEFQCGFSVYSRVLFLSRTIPPVMDQVLLPPLSSRVCLSFALFPSPVNSPPPPFFLLVIGPLRSGVESMAKCDFVRERERDGNVSDERRDGHHANRELRERESAWVKKRERESEWLDGKSTGANGKYWSTVFRFRLLLIRFADLADRNPREQSYINNRHLRGAVRFLFPPPGALSRVCMRAWMIYNLCACIRSTIVTSGATLFFVRAREMRKMRGHKRRRINE